MATTTEDGIRQNAEVNANYKTCSASLEQTSFEELAANTRSLVQKDSDSRCTTENCFLKESFRLPQSRSERFLSDDVGEEADTLGSDEDSCLPQVQSRVSTDMNMRPSLFNFKGFLEALSGDGSLKYEMTKSRRGLGLIFNNDIFDARLRLGRRSGSDVDARQLKKQLEALGFEVYVYTNLYLDELKRMIKHASSADHSDADSFVCAFLSHGEDEGLIYGYDGSIKLQELLNEFRGDRCPSLLGKPKIFIIQACRGREYEVGVCEVDSGVEDTDSKRLKDIAATIADDGPCTTVPAGADFLVCYSVVEGYFSFRDTISGSWYIQALCQALDTYGSTLEFTLILTLVNRMVAEKSVRRAVDPRLLGRKQMPCFVSMLTRQLIFSPKHRLRRKDLHK